MSTKNKKAKTTKITENIETTGTAQPDQIKQIETTEQKDTSTIVHTNNLNSISDEYKEIGVKYNLSKFEYDLYHEEYNTINKIIQVKRFGNLEKGEKWKIIEDTKIVLTIEGDKLTKKEKDFLRTPDGFRFLIDQYKNNKTTYGSIKKEMKKFVK